MRSKNVQHTALKELSGPLSISDTLAVERVRCNADASSKKKAIELVSELLAAGITTGPDAWQVAERLLAREKLGSTALGHGVAIPHGRCPDLEEATAAFVKLRSGVDFDAPDGEAVDIVVGLLVPEHCNDGHLQLLAQLAQIFSQPEIRDQLRTPVSPSQVLDILAQSSHQQ